MHDIYEKNHAHKQQPTYENIAIDQCDRSGIIFYSKTISMDELTILNFKSERGNEFHVGFIQDLYATFFVPLPLNSAFGSLLKCC